MRVFGRVWVALAIALGAAAGVVAQYLRQMVGPVGVLGGSTALWITLGYVLAWRAVHGRAWLQGWLRATAVMAAYLMAWVITYHTVFAVREQVGFASAWYEARPWLVVLAPAAALLGLIATGSSKRGPLGEVCLALPVAWSLPEAAAALDLGLLCFAIVCVPTIAVALVPLCAERPRGLSRVTVLATVVLGAVAVYYGLRYTAGW
ncbi:MAG TPA: hypothetical protein PLB30_06850 [Thermoleophilia bacterium]|nr:hypothetical protein [Anaerolineae bacterium]HQG04105.1 hypothetical protein [Thermoleophilia bacterium]HQJ98247.1 hypothetical protein [Thermoleophilia bacterium]